MQYKIVEGATIPELEERVNDLMRGTGWQPHGSMMAHPPGFRRVGTGSELASPKVFYQPMLIQEETVIRK